MVAVSISVEGMFGLTWPLWKRISAQVEQLGFDGLFRSDHFTLPVPVNLDSLELIVSLGYLAAHTDRVHFGSLVAPLSFRDPVMLARQSLAIDDLSGDAWCSVSAPGGRSVSTPCSAMNWGT
jgi:alkanesulfonate monooxygenase SsuD/methylene tetrahydromethanopterin reductase-like flavin-dependent oxidoreductase (luciferase family)